ncbi:hypothetical protein HDV00_005598 [Rhizophlyctis rosea]|nr:hypothetical protein HDV00_005598 [Rhizophlyctis rosea]
MDTIPISRIKILDNADILGSGAFGEVVKASYGRNMVAVKRTTVQAGGASGRELREEAEKMKQLNHPRIVRFYGVLEHEGTILIVMEYMEDGCLYDYLRAHGGKPISWMQRWIVSIDICEGLDYLHTQRNAFHQDLKREFQTISGNYIFHSYGSVFYGFTPVYQAPELKRVSAKFTRACDVYAYGVLLAELITLQRPENALRSWKSLAKSPKVPAMLVNLIKACLTEDPKLRPTVRQISDELEAHEADICWCEAAAREEVDLEALELSSRAGYNPAASYLGLGFDRSELSSQAGYGTRLSDMGLALDTTEFSDFEPIGLDVGIGAIPTESESRAEYDMEPVEIRRTSPLDIASTAKSSEIGEAQSRKSKATSGPVRQVRISFLEVDMVYGDELCMHVGETVVVRAVYKDGWFEGVNVTTGKSGMFPWECVFPKPYPKKDLSTGRSPPAFLSGRTAEYVEILSPAGGFLPIPFHPHPRNLTRLEFSSKHIQDLPSLLFLKSPHLKVLRVDHCGIRAIPSGIVHCQESEEIYMANNALQEVANEVGQLKALRILDISNNHVASLDDELFIATPSLTYLNLSGNRLQYLPTSLGLRASSLLALIFDNNPLDCAYEKLTGPVSWIKVRSHTELHYIDTTHAFDAKTIRQRVSE